MNFSGLIFSAFSVSLRIQENLEDLENNLAVSSLLYEKVITGCFVVLVLVKS